MEIEIKANGTIDEQEILDAIDCKLESKIETAVDYAIDNLDLSYQIEDALRDYDFSYTIGEEIENNSTLADYMDRVEKLENSLEDLALALPNNALAKVQEEKEELQAKFDELQKKFQALAGLEEASESEES